MTGNSTVFDESIETYPERKARHNALILSLKNRIESATSTDELVLISNDAEKSDLHWADAGQIIQACLTKFKQVR